ncbi:7SK snRNA methylphosphate capping enzyme [Trichuris trichiura]|uniref:RNA methyltransferase n=1 Tax=Trichuris trichiura TaxID=36087 RepID=A0A077YZ58_TRITR|nr:7SK snRNA methylphosphate capping enzyme [Trichuris trichiura]
MKSEEKPEEAASRQRPRTFSHRARTSSGVNHNGMDPAAMSITGSRKRLATNTQSARQAKRIQLPSKFLLGGNINDPLNLSGLPADTVIEQDSPVLETKSADEEVDIVIPRNPKDPLNLRFDDAESSVSHRRTRKRKRHTSVKADDLESIELADKASSVLKKGALSDSELPQAKKSRYVISPRPAQPPVDPIVSPVCIEKRKYVETGESSSKSQAESHDLRKRPHLGHKRPEGDSAAPSRKGKQKKFRYGNYSRYYGKRTGQVALSDPRMHLLQAEWFQGCRVLDIGCNVGLLTIAIAQEFSPRHIVGIDIDPYLVYLARKNLRMRLHYAELERLKLKFPPSFVEEYGPIVAPPIPARPDQDAPFPNNLSFKQSNYVLESDVFLDQVRPEYDTIIAFSITKWVHLNWGDDGLKRFFKRVYRNLKPGGRFLLEPQPFSSYKKRKAICPEMLENYNKISFHPDHFDQYLKSEEVGFVSSTTVGIPEHSSKGCILTLDGLLLIC